MHKLDGCISKARVLLESGLTRTEIAKRLGVTRAVFTRWFNYRVEKKKLSKEMISAWKNNSRLRARVGKLYSCCKCKKLLPATCFSKNKVNKQEGLEWCCKKCLNKRGIARRKRNRQVVFDYYGNRCACCGEVRVEFLTVDHIDGGGALHRKTVTHIYSWLIRNNFPSGFRILCANCNFSLGHYGYCPHQKEKRAIELGKERRKLLCSKQ